MNLSDLYAHGDTLWTDENTYYCSNNWADFKIYDSGKLDMATGKWVYDDTSVPYTPIGQGAICRYNQLVKNFSLNHTTNNETTMLIEGKTNGSNGLNKVALMTAMELSGGTNSGWASNPLMNVTSSWAPTSDAWAYGLEVDMNANSASAHAHYCGLFLTGTGTVDPDFAMAIGFDQYGGNNNDWKTGILMTDVKNYGISFTDSSPPSWGVHFSYACPNADIFHQDNGKAVYGTGSDMKICHSGGINRISTYNSMPLCLQKETSENMATFYPDGACELCYNSATKIATTNTGVTVTGCLVDSTCEIYTEDALAIIKDFLSNGSGKFDEYGHEHFDMERLYKKYPSLIEQHKDTENKTQYYDRLGAKSDLTYRAVMQLDKRIKALEETITK